MKRLMALVFLAVFVSSPAFAQQIDPISKWTTIAATEFRTFPNIVYQKSNNVSVKLDVITAGSPEETRPTLIYFHGGGWVEGVKEGALLNLLPYLSRGMNLVNVEYRLGPESLAPAAVEDCRCALRWVYQHAKEYGFDVNKIVTAGHSAGGHLALMTGMLQTNSGFDYGCQRLPDEWRLGTMEEVKVAAVINFYGPTDLVDLIQGPDTRNYAVRWFGNLPDRQELAKRLSPLSYVREGLPAILTIHGDADTIVPFAQAVRLHEALGRLADANELVTIRGGGHGRTPPNIWTREQNLDSQQRIFQFLVKHGVLSP
ncbi:MAG: alpha/beta hydrolase [Terriglobia bacterium]